MDILDEIFISHKCINLDMSWCEEIGDAVNHDIDFTEEFVKLNLDEMISEYLDRARAILNKSNVKYEKTEVDYYQPTITSENCSEYRHKFYDNPDYSFLYTSFDYIQGTIQLYESIVYNLIYDKTTSGIQYIILFFFVGIILFFFVMYYSYAIIKEIITSIKELINIVFIIPQSAIDASPVFKKLINNCELEEEKE
ncbi:hypothetical protein BCR36DRAFT_361424 [Piromyces finnis]|nr:hypothetical protein BCR36DRAFT_361424 [Piromyces finnis]|eukprot:ORX43310.1 hypothetical protein BCR36DRAFT_361424 [Piromyces finnis]